MDSAEVLLPQRANSAAQPLVNRRSEPPGTIPLHSYEITLIRENTDEGHKAQFVHFCHVQKEKHEGGRGKRVNGVQGAIDGGVFCPGGKRVNGVQGAIDGGVFCPGGKRVNGVQGAIDGGVICPGGKRIKELKATLTLIPKLKLLITMWLYMIAVSPTIKARTADEIIASHDRPRTYLNAVDRDLRLNVDENLVISSNSVKEWRQ
uniref:Uncharacterized protein n=1 Tax=Timema tahoe TaxID=61484 RepID=A0A7R9FMX0_9NEOP|nr:unnamed protein product [Timema tahoe]